MGKMMSTSVLIGTKLPLDDVGRIQKGMIFSLVEASGVTVWVCYCADPIRFSRVGEGGMGVFGLMRQDGYLAVRVGWSNIVRAVRWPFKRLFGGK